ncbi:unnamed protein product [Parnassius apollo]|uniref:(apollo) hypothetical protein n=1 Tax=Parnassius apollo TaxID=110799 RepID=A0A8S3VZF4_PARAO|nr:unnamed protein product [Parnassius apollo]
MGVTNNYPPECLSPHQPLSTPGFVDSGIPMRIYRQPETTIPPLITDIGSANFGKTNQNTKTHRQAVSRNDVTSERVFRGSEQSQALKEPAVDKRRLSGSMLNISSVNPSNSRVRRNVEHQMTA